MVVISEICCVLICWYFVPVTVILMKQKWMLCDPAIMPISLLGAHKDGRLATSLSLALSALEWLKGRPCGLPISCSRAEEGAALASRSHRKLRWLPAMCHWGLPQCWQLLAAETRLSLERSRQQWERVVKEESFSFNENTGGGSGSNCGHQARAMSLIFV